MSFIPSWVSEVPYVTVSFIGVVLGLWVFQWIVPSFTIVILEKILMCLGLINPKNKSIQDVYNPTKSKRNELDINDITDHLGDKNAQQEIQKSMCGGGGDGDGGGKRKPAPFRVNNQKEGSDDTRKKENNDVVIDIPEPPREYEFTLTLDESHHIVSRVMGLNYDPVGEIESLAYNINWWFCCCGLFSSKRALSDTTNATVSKRKYGIFGLRIMDYYQWKHVSTLCYYALKMLIISVYLVLAFISYLGVEWVKSVLFGYSIISLIFGYFYQSVISNWYRGFNCWYNETLMVNDIILYQGRSWRVQSMELSVVNLMEARILNPFEPKYIRTTDVLSNVQYNNGNLMDFQKNMSQYNQQQQYNPGLFPNSNPLMFPPPYGIPFDSSVQMNRGMHHDNKAMKYMQDSLSSNTRVGPVPIEYGGGPSEFNWSSNVKQTPLPVYTANYRTVYYRDLVDIWHQLPYKLCKKGDFSNV